jgi:hypothetical protein
MAKMIAAFAMSDKLSGWRRNMMRSAGRKMISGIRFGEVISYVCGEAQSRNGKQDISLSV